VLFTGVVDRDRANTRADAVCGDFGQLPAIIDSLAGERVNKSNRDG
jgi:hypothetical protein